MASKDSRGVALRPEPPDAATAAWLCTIPCTLLSLTAIVVLGPPLGGLLAPGGHRFHFLPDALPGILPEPTEHARYLLALGAPLLLALATVLVARRSPRMSPRAMLRVVWASEAALAAVLVGCFLVQPRLRYGLTYTAGQGNGILTLAYFKTPTLLVAAALASLTIAATRSAQGRERVRRLLRETRVRRVAALVAALVTTSIWMLLAVHTDRSIAELPPVAEDVRYHLAFTIDEAFAVLNGLTPLVSFTAPYSSLWPYLSAGAMAVFGKDVLVFTITMAALTTIAFLAIFGVLRRAARSSLGALLLYLPFVATSAFSIAGTSVERSTVTTYFAVLPLRSAGPFLLAWLTARHLDGERRLRATLALFAVAGLAALNNADFGFPAVGATIAALVWTARPTRREASRLVAVAVAGLAIALALVSLLTLLRADSLPQFARLVDYAAVFSIGGMNMMPIKGILGLHVAIYLTYVGAIATATVRTLRGAGNRVLTGMLAWSGVFGLGAGFYWVGRSHPVALKYQFAAWSLALALLTIAVVHELSANPARRPSLSSVAVLFGFGLAVCSLAQLPLPWSQIQRLETTFVPTREAPYEHPLAPSTDRRTREFVMSLADGPRRFVVKRGAPVAILLTTGHRVADAYGIRNVSPLIGETLFTTDDVDTVIDALRKAGGNTIVLPDPLLLPSMFKELERRGFRVLTHSGLRRYRPHTGIVLVPWLGRESMNFVPTFVMKWVDTRHLHPRALSAGPSRSARP
jgi:hypothetical protein